MRWSTASSQRDRQNLSILPELQDQNMQLGGYLQTVTPQAVGIPCVQDVDPVDPGPTGRTVEKLDSANILMKSRGYPNAMHASRGSQNEMEGTL